MSRTTMPDGMVHVLPSPKLSTPLPTLVPGATSWSFHSTGLVSRSWADAEEKSVIVLFSPT